MSVIIVDIYLKLRQFVYTLSKVEPIEQDQVAIKVYGHIFVPFAIGNFR